MKIRAKLIIDIETDIDDKSSTEDTLRYLVEDDLADSRKLNYIVHSCTVKDPIDSGGISPHRELLIAYELKMRNCSDEQAEVSVDSYLASKVFRTDKKIRYNYYSIEYKYGSYRIVFAKNEKQAIKILKEVYDQKPNVSIGCIPYALFGYEDWSQQQWLKAYNELKKNDGK